MPVGGRARALAVGAVVLLCAWALLAGPAFAALTVIGFDTLPDGSTLPNGATVTTQYHSIGVDFGQRQGEAPPVVNTIGNGAPSFPNVLDITKPGEFTPPFVTGNFVATQRQSLSVAVAATSAVEGATVRLIGYDAPNTQGNVVASSAQVPITSGQGFVDLTATSASANIVSFEITGRNGEGSVAIDNFTFDNPTAPQPPVFDFSTATGAQLVQGASVALPIAIARFNDPSPVLFSITGLPAGVTASFDTNPTAGDTARLTLTAAPDAPPVHNALISLTGEDFATRHSHSIVVDLDEGFSITTDKTAVNLKDCPVAVAVTATRSLGFPGPVQLSATGLPPGVQASFDPAVLTFPTGGTAQTSTLTFTATPTGIPTPSQTVTIHAAGGGLPDRTVALTVAGACPAAFDARITSMEVTQGIQTPLLPAPRASSFGQTASYNTPSMPTVTFTSAFGIPAPLSVPFSSPLGESTALLQARGKTVVRVFANARFAPPEGVTDVEATLFGFEQRTGKPLGTPLLSDGGSRTLQQGLQGVTTAELADPGGAFTFTLPQSWTLDRGEPVRFEAVLLPPVATPGLPAPGRRSLRECSDEQCHVNNRFDLTDIRFHPSASTTIAPIEMRVNNQALASPAQVFAAAVGLTPLDVTVLPYQGTVDITDLAKRYTDGSDDADAAVNDRVDDWDSDHGRDDFTIGVNTSLARGRTNSCNYQPLSIECRRDAVVVELARPYNSVAHEFYHLLGRNHASGDCHASTAGSDYDQWPPDMSGFIQGIGLDRRAGSGGSAGPYAIITPSTTSPWYDVMSYCSDDGAPPLFAPATGRNDWISLHTWNSIIRGAHLHAAAAALASSSAAARSGDRLRVKATAGPDGVAIHDVAPLRGGSLPSTGTSDRLVVLDADGRVLSDTAMFGSPAHIDHGPEETELQGLGTWAGAARVEIIDDGHVVASRSRSASAPRLAITYPHRGSRVGRARRTTARWRASDDDADPLTVFVDYSADGGRTWQTIFIGPNHGRAGLPNRYFTTSQRARLRVRVSDGFNETTRISPSFIAEGAPPLVSITSPIRGQRAPSDSSLYLSGQAFDDASRPLEGRRLRWYVHHRLIGTGATTSVTDLPGGSQTIRLVARDKRGRTASASGRIRVIASRPRFITLSVPKVLSRRARRVTLRVAANLPSALTVAHRRYRVGRHVTAVRVRIRPGRKPLVLGLSLRSRGKVASTIVTIHRR